MDNGEPLGQSLKRAPGMLPLAINEVEAARKLQRPGSECSCFNIPGAMPVLKRLAAG